MDGTGEAFCQVMLLEPSSHAHISGVCAFTQKKNLQASETNQQD